MAPQVGLEPTTLRLTAECSAIELLRNIHLFSLPENGIIILPFCPFVNLENQFSEKVPAQICRRSAQIRLQAVLLCAEM